MIDKLCNYKEQSTNGGDISVSYVNFLSSEDIHYQNELKRKNRELKIGELFGEDVNHESLTELSFGNEIPSISSVIKTVKVSPLKYKDISEVSMYLIDFLNKNTRSKKVISNMSNASLDVTLSNDPNLTYSEKFEVSVRKIITKINLHKNLISMQGRIGTSQSIIVGKSNWVFFKYIEDMSITSMSNQFIIYDESIDKDKVILCRSNNIDQAGIILINDVDNKIFYMKETDSWKDQYSWFNIN